MIQKTRRAIIGVLVIVIATLLLIEAMLHLVDPIGLHYFEDTVTFYNHALPTAHGYRFVAGRYPIGAWSFTITDDGTRFIPDNGNGDQVVFVGDSITFAWGVNDDETWINRIAQQTDIQAINAGLPGYNATQILETVKAHPDAKQIVYLSFHNDDQPPTAPGGTATMTSRLSVLITLAARTPETERDAAYDDSMQALAADDRVLILAFDGDDYGQRVARDYGAVLIPPYTSILSAVDQHADAAGNQQIAERAIPLLTRWIAKGNDTRGSPG